MGQETFVTKVPKGSFKEVESRIATGPFEFRPVPHAVFSAKGDGVVATLYSSGKFVIQGPDPQAFLAKWTDFAGAPSAKKASKSGSGSNSAQEPIGEGDPLDLSLIHI